MSSISFLAFCVACVLMLCSTDAFVARFGSLHRRVCPRVHTLKMINPVEFKAQLSADMKDAMKLKQKVRLMGIRAIQAAVKQKEIELQKDLSEDGMIGVMNKIVKTHKESILSFNEKGRPELAAEEQARCDVVTSYLPQQLTTEEVTQLVEDTIARLGATNVKDMGKVMAELKPQLMGKTDITAVGNLIRGKLGVK